MALSDDEIDKIKLMLRAEIAPIDQMMHKLHQTVYGAEGNNGMNKAVKELMRFRWIVTGALIVIGSATFWQVLRILQSISKQ